MLIAILTIAAMIDPYRGLYLMAPGIHVCVQRQQTISNLILLMVISKEINQFGVDDLLTVFCNGTDIELLIPLVGTCNESGYANLMHC